MVGGLSKNVGLHGWSTTENLKCTLTKTPNNSPQKTKLGPQNKLFRISFIFEVYLLFSDFPAEVLKPTKTGKKDHPFYHTVSLIKSYLFYEPQLTQHGQKPTRFTNFLANMFLVGVRKNIRPRTAFSKHWESKCLYIPVYLCKKLLSGDGLNNFL